MGAKPVAPPLVGGGCLFMALVEVVAVDVVIGAAVVCVV